MDVHAASCTLAVISEKGRKLRDFPVETVRRQNFSDDWIVLSVRPNDKAPEVLKTPGASFLGSGGALQHMHPRDRNPAGASLGGMTRGLRARGRRSPRPDRYFRGNG
jgi:hypothetical protein